METKLDLAKTKVTLYSASKKSMKDTRVGGLLQPIDAMDLPQHIFIIYKQSFDKPTTFCKIIYTNLRDYSFFNTLVTER